MGGFDADSIQDLAEVSEENSKINEENPIPEIVEEESASIEEEEAEASSTTLSRGGLSIIGADSVDEVQELAEVNEDLTSDEVKNLAVMLAQEAVDDNISKEKGGAGGGLEILGASSIDTIEENAEFNNEITDEDIFEAAREEA